MSDNRKAYDHTSTVTGGRARDDEDPALEHQDTAHGQQRDTNPVDARRGEPERRSPSPGHDTRIDGKEE